MSEQEYSIGALAKAGGIKVQTVRYYEKIGILSEPYRSPGNQRRYTDGHMERLMFIRHGRSLGFSLDQIRGLLDLSDDPDRPCNEVDAIARLHLSDVRNKIARLRDLEKELKRMVRECSGGRVSGCRIIEVLSDHDLCLTDHH